MAYSTVVQNALEERAEDGGFHPAPVELRGIAQDAHVLVGQIEDCVVIGAKQAAVEVVNSRESKLAVARRHRGKELFQLADKLFGLLAVNLNGLAEEIVGQQPYAVGKKAEQEAHDKAGHGVVVFVACAQVVLQAGELLGRPSGYPDFESAGLELLRLLEDGAQDVEWESEPWTGVARIRSSSVNL